MDCEDKPGAFSWWNSSCLFLFLKAFSLTIKSSSLILVQSTPNQFSFQCPMVFKWAENVCSWGRNIEFSIHHYNSCILKINAEHQTRTDTAVIFLHILHKFLVINIEHPDWNKLHVLLRGVLEPHSIRNACYISHSVFLSQREINNRFIQSLCLHSQGLLMKPSNCNSKREQRIN